MDDERPRGYSTSLPCGFCGCDERDDETQNVRGRTTTYQVIVACASCGAAFAALSRN